MLSHRFLDQSINIVKRSALCLMDAGVGVYAVAVGALLLAPILLILLLAT